MSIITFILLETKYYILTRNSRIKQSFLSVLRIGLISRFYGQFIPSSGGKDAVRWYKMTKNREGKTSFLASTLFERLLFVLVSLGVGSLALYRYSNTQEMMAFKNILWPAIFFILIIVLLSIGYLLIPSWHFTVNGFLLFLIPSFLRKDKLINFLHNLLLTNKSFIDCCGITALSLLWQFFYISGIYFLFRALTLPVNFVDVTWVGSLELLAHIVPISFFGIGVREGTFVLLLGLLNLQPEYGVLLGILFFSQMLIFFLIGGILELFCQ